MRLPAYVEYEEQNKLKLSMEKSDWIIKISNSDFNSNILNTIVNYERIVYIDSENKKIYFNEEADDSNISIKYELMEVL